MRKIKGNLIYSLTGCNVITVLIRVLYLRHDRHFETKFVYFMGNQHRIRDNPECNETEPIPTVMLVWRILL